MQTTTVNWRQLAATGTATMEARVTVDGTEYPIASPPVITRAFLDGQRLIGNCTAAMLQVTLRTTAILAKGATVVVTMRLTDGTTTSTYEQGGTYYINRRDIPNFQIKKAVNKS